VEIRSGEVAQRDWPPAIGSRRAAHTPRSRCSSPCNSYTFLLYRADSLLSTSSSNLTVSYGIGSNSNQLRLLLGERVLTAPFFQWQYVYIPFLEAFLNEEIMATNRTLWAFAQVTYYDIASGAVALAPLSALLPFDIQQRVAIEQQRLMQLSSQGRETIFCGPIYDNAGKLRFAAGTCATLLDMATMGW
jgi:hypothetical protein